MNTNTFAASRRNLYSKDLKHRGFSFVASTVVYAHMHAVGMMNDHLVDCFRYREIRRLDSVIERAVTGCRLPSLAAERLVLIPALVLSGAVKNDSDIVVWASLTKQ